MYILLLAIVILYGSTHFASVDWNYILCRQALAVFVASFVILACLVIGQMVHQYICKPKKQSDEEIQSDLGNTNANRKQKHQNWDIDLFLGVGVVGICNAVFFWMSVPLFSLIWIPTSLYLFYQNIHSLYGYSQKKRQEIFYEYKNVFLVVALWGCIGALGAVIDTDALYYHISVPKNMWNYGQTFGGVLHANGSRPLLMPSIDALLYGCGGTPAIGVFRLWMGVALLISFVQRGGTFFGVCLLLGSTSFIQEFGLYGYNLSVAFGVWLCFCLMTQQKYNPVVVGIIAGITLSIKYTSLGPLLAIWLFGISSKREDIKYRCMSFVWVAAIVVLWPMRNLWEGLHPLFPYAGWTEQFQMLEKYGMGREWKDILLLPYNVLVHAKPYSDQFLGRIHPLWALTIPLVLWEKQYRSFVVFGVCCIFWSIGPHWIRHMIVFLPIGASIFSKNIPKRLMHGIWFVYMLLLPWQLSTLLLDIEAKIQSVFLMSEAETLQSKKVPGWDVGKWIKEHTPKDAKIAFFYSWSGLATDRYFVLGSVEEHIPTRNWLMTHKNQSLLELQKLGIDYVVVGPAPKYKAGWDFLQKSDFEQRFVQPQNMLNNCLLRDAVMLYQHKGFSFYRIRN